MNKFFFGVVSVMDEILQWVFLFRYEDIKFAVIYELNKAQNLLSEIQKLSVLNARVTVFSKSFF